MTTSDTYKTAQQVADKLGFSVETIYDWAQRGTIPVAFRVGGRLRFDIDAVVAALNDGTRDEAAAR